MSDDIQKLIAENRQLLANLKSKAREPKKEVVFRFIDPCRDSIERENYSILRIFMPTERPEIIPPNCRIEIHGHNVELLCKVKHMCHELDYEPTADERSLFYAKWGFLYNKEIKLDHIKFDLEM